MSGKASGHGSEHWWRQRITAVSLALLGIFLICGLVSVLGQDYATASARFSNPGVAAVVILFIIVAFYHASLGLQVIFEDYVEGRARTICIVAMQLICALLTVTGIVSVISLLS